jgi:hypothetical protein
LPAGRIGAAGSQFMMGRETMDGGGQDSLPRTESFDDASTPELISPASLLGYLDEIETGEEGGEDGPLPQILQMPEGMKVEERRVGRAVAQWILQVRCDCGRRWFEAAPVDATTCPRCGVLVYVDMDSRGPRP